MKYPNRHYRLNYQYHIAVLESVEVVRTISLIKLNTVKPLKIACDMICQALVCGYQPNCLNNIICVGIRNLGELFMERSLKTLDLSEMFNCQLFL